MLHFSGSAIHGGSRASRLRYARRAIGAVVALAAMAALVVSAAQAAAPANDTFSQASVLAGEAGAVSGTNVEASTEPGERTPGGGRSVWYRWTSPFSGQALFETCGSNFDTVLAVYAGDTLPGLSQIAANDDGCRAGSRVAVEVAEGSTYRVVVDGFDGEAGAFTLRWQRLQRPANDDLAAAAPLDGASGTLEATTFAATMEPGEPSAAATATVWYVWTTPTSGVAVVDTCGDTSETVVSAYSGDAPAGLTRVGFSDGACGPASRVRFPAEAGQTFRIAVGGRGDFRLSWVVAVPPANDAFGAARAISGNRGSLAASTIAASKESEEQAHGGYRGGSSVWYRWRAPSSRRVAFATCNAPFNTVLAVYRRASAGLVPVRASDGGCRRARGSLAVVHARAGTVYFIAVDGIGGVTGSFRLTWGTPPPWVEPCFVPNVRGGTLAQARRAIARSNCRVGRIGRAASTIVPRGRVVAQFPEPGTRLRFGGRVHLEVSAGRRR